MTCRPRGYNTRMDEDDERDMRHLDPANLLPYEHRLEPEDEDVEKLPQQYQGSGDDFYSGTAVF
jgi:hypothetical protein